ncbi:MAG: hypothetical protein QME51_07715 [Planctomycetota bacterium]|nr:hypothetical protein [Planctomycetota bacterium]
MIISKLTKEQEIKIPYYIQKWIELASQPIDREKAKEMIKKIFKKDKIIIFGESLDNTMGLIKVATNNQKLEYDQQLDHQLRQQLAQQLDQQLAQQLAQQLDRQLRQQLDRQLAQQNIKYSRYVSYYLYDWAGYYDYGKYIRVKFDEDKLQDCFNILLNIPIVIFIGNIIFICEKPKCLWENKRLHSETKPAIGWQDGTGIYFLNGIRLEKDLWQSIVSKTISVKDGLALENTEHRALAMKYLGFERLKEETNPKQVGQDQYGEIVELDIKDINNDPVRYFVGIDPSKGEPCYLLTPPDVSSPKEFLKQSYQLERFNLDYSPLFRT